jgi:hypothetical protein
VIIEATSDQMTPMREEVSRTDGIISKCLEPT